MGCQTLSWALAAFASRVNRAWRFGWPDLLTCLCCCLPIALRCGVSFCVARPYVPSCPQRDARGREVLSLLVLFFPEVLPCEQPPGIPGFTVRFDSSHLRLVAIVSKHLLTERDVTGAEPASL